MSRYVLHFDEIDRTQIAVVGGKGAHLGELSRVSGVRVPDGFCVTTDAYRRIVADAPSLPERLDALSRLTAADADAIRALAADIRHVIETTPVPAAVASAILDAYATLGERTACAVRSSATAEDLPTASFAGQHDSYLNVVAGDAIPGHVRQCWASLFTERAVTYRAHHGIDHRAVQMAVVVQRMIFPHASGVLFTADPITGHRKVVAIEAIFGLGEALVSGLVTPDVYRVRNGAIVERSIAAKRLAIVAAPLGGTEQRAIEPARQHEPALGDAQVARLAALGGRIAAHFGEPQDVEWCLESDDFVIVQSRPITTLFPVPAQRDDENHVYVSVGHQQMMTDPMRPLGLSVWQMTTARPMAEAGGRLFVDVTRALASPASRAALLQALGSSDPLIGDALQSIVDRGDFLPPVPNDAPAWTPPGVGHAAIATDPAIVSELIANTQASVDAARRAIHGRSGPALLDFIADDIGAMRRVQFDPRSLQVVMASVEAARWLNERMLEWLGERNAADALAQSVPHNVTSEMGLALLDVADAIRPHAEVVAFLERVGDDDTFLDALPAIPGGREARDAMQCWLDRYGMRGVGEIDITRPRWSERPSMLVPILLGHVAHFAPNEAERRFERGRQVASNAERDLLARLHALPNGAQKAGETKRAIDRLRTFAGYREYPKYGMIARYFVYKQALMAEADRLVQAGVLRERGDVFFLRVDELREVARTQQVDETLLRERRDAFAAYAALTPPRVLTSDGEAVAGSYRRDDLPPNALVGLAVSAGTVEGRARVVLDVAAADLAPGDILVTAFTDPSWTPRFVGIGGLVTEVGGLMTHGAVIAREYGLPAVVGVEHATRRIRDGQRIRVHGTDGFVELLP